MEQIRIVVATHKKYIMPDDPMYLPTQAGAAGKESIVTEDVSGRQVLCQRDDEGENISDRNWGYSELTAVYWAAKNLDAHYIGLCHYRRYFKSEKRSGGRDIASRLHMALSTDEALQLMEQADIIVPARRHYYIESLYSHYDHTHYRRHFDMTAEIIEQMYPGRYNECLDTVYSRTWGYMYNMFIMSREYLNEYLDFLLPVLYELERQLREEGLLEGLSPFEARLFGRVSEILLDVWVESKRVQGAVVMEVPTFYTEKEHMGRKGLAFLKAKFLGEKYKKSF